LGADVTRLTYLIWTLLLGVFNLAAIGFIIVYANGGAENFALLMYSAIIWIPVLIASIGINFAFCLGFLFPAADLSRIDPEDWIKGKKKSHKRKSRRRNPVLHLLYEVVDEVFD